ncbi:MAG: hypothetical protein WAZ18_02100 [Alphaproteobacteria bacterium]
MTSPQIVEARKNKAKKAIMCAVKLASGKIELDYDADKVLRSINYAAKGLNCDEAMLEELLCELRDHGEVLYDETTRTAMLEREVEVKPFEIPVLIAEPVRSEGLPHEKLILETLAKSGTAMNTFQIGEKAFGTIFESQTPEFLATIKVLTEKGVLVRYEPNGSAKSKKIGSQAATYALSK